MENDQPITTAARRRMRGPEATVRASALERLKLVTRRHSEVQGFIVDEDGLCYRDKGEAEDWSQAGLPPSSDEYDGGGDTNNKNRYERRKQRRKRKSLLLMITTEKGIGEVKVNYMLYNNVAKNLKVNDELGTIVVNDCDYAVQLNKNCSVYEREGVFMKVKDEEEKGVDYNEKREDLSEVKEEVVKIESKNRHVGKV